MTDINNLTAADRMLLDKMNTKANLIISIEEVLRAIKLPMDKNVLYEKDIQELKDIYEMLSNAMKNRETMDETNRDN